MPHPLPEDIDNVSGLKWFLAAVPDDPAFTRAAWDVFTDLANYWKWGLEGPVPEDSDKAAQLWSNAVYETIEAYQMGFPQTLLDYIDEVEDLLRALQATQSFSVDCCDNLGPIAETVGSDLENEGPPPDTWGDEAVSDLEDWQQLVCGAAHAYVDYLKAMADSLEDLVALGAVSVGAIAGILSLLAGAGILLTISYTAAATVTAGIIAGAVEGLFGDVPAALEAARADIVCEIVHGDPVGMASAIEGAISASAWTLMYSHVDYASARNVMLEGDHGGEALGVNRRSDCDCVVPISFTVEMPDLQNWSFLSTDGVGGSDGFCTSSGSGNQKMNPDAPSGDVGTMSWRVSTLATIAGFDTTGFTDAFIQRVELDYTVGTSGNFTLHVDIPMEGGGALSESFAADAGAHAHVYVPEQQTPFPTGGFNLQIRVPKVGSSALQNQLCFNRVRIDVLML